jgi:hypothetical protein
VDGDDIAFLLLVGLPILAISWLVAKLLLAFFARGWAIALCLALIIAWPAYFVAMTLGEPGFVPGLTLLAITSPPMVAGLLLALLRLPRRAAAQ